MNIEPNYKSKMSYNTARYPIRQPPALATEEIYPYAQVSRLNRSK